MLRLLQELDRLLRALHARITFSLLLDLPNRICKLELLSHPLVDSGFRPCCCGTWVVLAIALSVLFLLGTLVHADLLEVLQERNRQRLLQIWKAHVMGQCLTAATNSIISLCVALNMRSELRLRELLLGPRYLLRLFLQADVNALDQADLPPLQPW